MMKSIITLLSSLLFSTFFWQSGFAQPHLTVTQITSVSSPVGIASPNDGSNRLFILEKAGRIRIYNQNTSTLLPANFLDIAGQVSASGERGLLGLAFHPDYASNGHFFVNYTNNAGDTRVSRFTVSMADPNIADAGSELVILAVAQPYANHNGGDLAFGPDGYLYIPLGDGGDGGDPDDRSQNLQELLGKMLRINIDSSSGGNNYAIPPDNPFVGVQTPTDFLDEIWALGLRNPWRFSFDRLTGDIWIGDVGQGAWEEVNFQPAASNGGENYGWRCYEGNHPYDTSGCGPIGSYDFPVFEYGHNPTTGGNSITGGFVYRGSDVPSLQGWYIMADFTSDNFWLIRPDGIGGWTTRIQTDVPIVDVVTFGEDQDGELFVASLGGQVYSISENSNPCPLDSILTINPLDMETVSASNTLTTSGAVTIASNNMVAFRAGTGITLAEEFSVQLGADFTAYIEDCNVVPLMPPPANGKAGVMGNPTKNTNFRVFDGIGRLVRTGTMKDNPSNHLSNEPAGLYLISIDIENQTVFKKVVIE